MKKDIFNMLTNEGSEIDKILNRSSRAVCGAFEKEVVVRNENVNKVKQTLKKSGFIIVGTGKAGMNTTKVWFNPAGVNL